MIVCKLGWAGQSKAGRGWLAGPLSKAGRRWLVGQSWARLAGWAGCLGHCKQSFQNALSPTHDHFTPGNSAHACRSLSLRRSANATWHLGHRGPPDLPMRKASTGYQYNKKVTWWDIEACRFVTSVQECFETAQTMKVQHYTLAQYWVVWICLTNVNQRIQLHTLVQDLAVQTCSKYESSRTLYLPEIRNSYSKIFKCQITKSNKITHCSPFGLAKTSSS